MDEQDMNHALVNKALNGPVESTYDNNSMMSNSDQSGSTTLKVQVGTSYFMDSRHNLLCSIRADAALLHKLRYDEASDLH